MAPRKKYIVKDNERYGKLVTIEKVVYDKDPYHPYHKCKCDCGNIVYVRDSFLCKGTTQSCGCLRRYVLDSYQSGISKKSSLPIGTVIGNLTIEEDLGVIQVKKKREHCYRCTCSCGNTVTVRQTCLKNGDTTSCGCNKLTNARKTKSENARLRRVYPDWLTSLLNLSEEINGVLEKKYPYEHNLHFKCSSCGEEVIKPISYIIHLNNDRDIPIVLCLNCSNHRSSFEEEVYQYIVTFIPYDMVQRNVWGVLRNGKTPYELDIYIPKMNIAIECNGDYFHSTKNDKNINYHLNKFKLAEDRGIRLIQIFESTWKSKTDHIKEFLKDIFSKKYKVYARSCLVESIITDKARSFYDENHIQGSTFSSRINYSLIFNNETVAVMGFSNVSIRARNNKDPGFYELVRFAVKKGYSVIGGASKLLYHFEKDYRPSIILSYSDNDYFSGNMYAKLGFSLESYTRPRYHWYLKDCSVRTREQCQLKKLCKLYPSLYKESVDKHVSNKEDYIMESQGALKVYHSGNKKWVKYYDSPLSINPYTCLEKSDCNIKQEVIEWLRELKVKFDTTAYFSDIFISDHKLGICINSVYPDVLERPKNYYRDKFYMCENMGIRLVTLFRMDWERGKEKLKDLIKYSIFPKEKIYARKCTVEYVGIDEATLFYNKYHIQNKSSLAKINIGLYYKGNLISVMGFGSSSFHNRSYNDGDYELHRFVTKTGYTVVGGASKLLKYFEEEYKPKFLLSYSWNDWFDGKLYQILGFTLDRKVPPDYYWYLDGKCLDKRKCRLKYIQSEYPTLYQEALDKQASNKEDYVMKSLGAVKIYRSGSKRWVKRY